MNNTYTKEFLIGEFWRFYKENGKYPLSSDFRNNKDYPNIGTYNRNWGKWSNFLDVIGVLGDEGWFKCDEQILIDLYVNSTKEEIIDKLMVKRTWNSIIKKANKLGLHKVNRNIDWDNLVEDYLCEITDLDILAGKYHVNNKNVIRDYLIRNNLYKYTVFRWSDKNEKYLIDNIYFKSFIEIAQDLNINITNVIRKCQTLKLIHFKSSIYYISGYKPNNQHEEYFYNFIKNRLILNQLIDISTIIKIIDIDNFYQYLSRVFG